MKIEVDSSHRMICSPVRAALTDTEVSYHDELVGGVIAPVEA